MKIGLFGGAFNPVHQDHLTIARECVNKLALDRLLIIPNSSPPHKNTCNVSYQHRVEMLKLALSDAERLEICDIEADPQAKHYSYQTCEALRTQFGENARLFFIMGADSLMYLDEWYRGLELIELTNLVITNRVGYQLDTLKTQLQPFVRAHYQELPSSLADSDFAPSGGLFFLDLPLNEISSSAIRTKLRQGEKPAELCDLVYDYILAHGLYRD